MKEGRMLYAIMPVSTYAPMGLRLCVPRPMLLYVPVLGRPCLYAFMFLWFLWFMLLHIGMLAHSCSFCGHPRSSVGFLFSLL